MENDLVNRDQRLLRLRSLRVDVYVSEKLGKKRNGYMVKLIFHLNSNFQTFPLQSLIFFEYIAKYNKFQLSLSKSEFCDILPPP